MKEIVKQYKNLILLATIILLSIILLCADPVGFFVERRQVRAAASNRMEIERAETLKQITIIRAETEAEIYRIRNMLPENNPEDEEPEEMEVETIEQEQNDPRQSL